MSIRVVLCILLFLMLVQGVQAAEKYTFVTKWGTQGSGAGQFNSPAGVAVDSSGNVYVADYSNHRIQKFSSTGTFLTKWGSYGSGDGQFDHPLIVAVDSSGNVYVADTWNQRIQKFSSTGTFLTKWGSYGSGDGQFQDPNSVAIDSSGNVYVADLRNNRIQKFSSTGTFLTKWGSSGSGDGQFNFPRDIAIDSSGNVYVADYNNKRIQKFSSTGTFLTKWGSSGSGDGQFSNPSGVTVDSSGNVYVADYDNNRIQKFSSTGTFLTKWGLYGSGDGQFNLPTGVAADSSGNVYVADDDNNRIQKFSIQTVTPTAVPVQAVFIRIDPVGNKYVGNKFTITAQTNLAVDDKVLIEVYSSSFKPTQKSQSSATGTVKVTKGDSGLNKISFDIDVSTFKPDEYIVKESAVIQDVNGVALFNVLEGAAPTTFPTAVKTTASSTTVATIAASTPSDISTQLSDTFNPLIIVGIILLLCIGGGGYYVLRSRKTRSPRPPSSGIQPPSPPEQTAASPNLILTPEKTQFVVNKWHRVPVHITNTGTAHAVDVSFTFSNEFETKWMKPVSIETGVSTDVIIGLRPKQDGNIPLDIQVQYKDVRNKEYKQTFEYWIDVLDSFPAADAQPPSSFTPKPLTPKQPPAELSDRYTDWEFIGKGGFARVFKAKRKDGQFVAVKIPISLDESTGKSFIAELQNWTHLDHPNIVKVYNFNILPSAYFEMELCDSSLAERNKPIESEEAAWILFNVCEGLKFTHAQKIIHRDLKPQNILLKNGVPKISDWGLSRVITESTSTTAASFTPYYAAPEQISSEHKDERTDIWQLGIIFYELVTGQLPFTGDSMVAVMAAIATKNPQLPSAINASSHDVEVMIMKCLEKNPNKRYQSVLEFQKDLALYLRVTYTESLKKSVSVQDYTRSAYYCGDLVMVNLLTGDMKSAYKYLLDFVHYSKGDVKVEAQELSEQIKMRMEMGVTEVPDELIQKAEIIVLQVNVGFRNRG